MPISQLSSVVLAIGNKSELSENACLITTEFDHFMNAYWKEPEKPVVDNKPATPTDKDVLGDLFDNCLVVWILTSTKKITVLSK